MNRITRALYHNTVKHLAAFNYRGTNTVGTPPGRAMLDPAIGFDTRLRDTAVLKFVAIAAGAVWCGLERTNCRLMPDGRSRLWPFLLPAGT